MSKQIPHFHSKLLSNNIISLRSRSKQWYDCCKELKKLPQGAAFSAEVTALPQRPSCLTMDSSTSQCHCHFAIFVLHPPNCHHHQTIPVLLLTFHHSCIDIVSALHTIVVLSHYCQSSSHLTIITAVSTSIDQAKRSGHNIKLIVALLNFQ